MTLDEEHIDEVCEDIAYQVKNGIASMPLFMMPLTPEGDPVIDKAELCWAQNGLDLWNFIGAFVL